MRTRFFQEPGLVLVWFFEAPANLVWFGLVLHPTSWFWFSTWFQTWFWFRSLQSWFCQNLPKLELVLPKFSTEMA
jgi:hypothetical protein